MNIILSWPALNPYLLVGALLSFIASGLHLACIVGGANWLRFFGAGERMAVMAENGSWYPGIMTGFIAVVLMVMATYALAGAAAPGGAGTPLVLPFLKGVLVAITAVYLLRGVLPFLVAIFKPEIMVSFTLWSSLIVLVYGLVHAVGLFQVWGRL